MTTIKEIESAIECLSASEVAELAAWVDQLRVRRAALPPYEDWLEHPRGAAQPGVSTENLMALTRGDE